MKEKSFIKQNKNKIICFIVTLLLAAFTIYAVFSGGGISFDELMTCIKNASWPELILAMLSMLGFIYFEGEAIRVIVAHMGYPTKRSHVLSIRLQMYIFQQLHHLHQVDNQPVPFL